MCYNMGMHKCKKKDHKYFQQLFCTKVCTNGNNLLYSISICWELCLVATKNNASIRPQWLNQLTDGMARTSMTTQVRALALSWSEITPARIPPVCVCVFDGRSTDAPVLFISDSTATCIYYSTIKLCNFMEWSLPPPHTHTLIRRLKHTYYSTDIKERRKPIRLRSS